MTGEVERVLVVVAHPDDVDFGAAGSIATWTDAGIDVQYCLVTDGDAGGFDRTIARSEMALIRRREQTRAAHEVGVSMLHFLGFADGRVEANLELREAISRVIRQVRPQRVVTHSPERNFQRIYASHPDHLAAAEATFCAVYPDARNPFAFTDLLANEGLEPWAVDEIWMMSGPSNGAAQVAWVDITDALERKIRALMSHESQFTDPAGIADRVRQWAASNALNAGLGEGRGAEAFVVVDTR